MSRPFHIHVFSIPPELLTNITSRSITSNVLQQDAEATVPSAAGEQQQGARACNVCQIATFADVEDQRTHFRSDWHRYNVKARLANRKAVNEAEFGQLVDELNESLSGSESSSEEDDAQSESDPDAVETLISKAKSVKVQSRSESPTGESSGPKSALAWFHAPPNTQLGIYRSIFSSPSDFGSFVSELRALQRNPPAGRRWALFMTAGGHFAGAIVRVSREDVPGDETARKGKQKVAKPEIEILKHKTFHRYTTRRKQGGSQGLNDNAKGNAKSAGAQLRRYGEQALRDDIQSLLEDWSEELASCERIWLRASGTLKRTFWDFDNSPILKRDERLRTFPFPTRRPTQSELSRCLLELTRVQITRYTEEELRIQDEAFIASLPKPRPKPVTPIQEPKLEKKVPKMSKEEEILHDKWERLLDMIKKGRLDSLKTFWDREGSSLGGVDSPLPAWTNERASTLLQLAAASSQEAVTAWLLVDLHADPTIPVAIRPDTTSEIVDGMEDLSTQASGQTMHRTAYDLASDKAIRDLFRRTAAEHPDWWDWLTAARVPSLLSKEMEEERENKKKTRRKGLKEKIKDREVRSPREKSPEPQVLQTETKKDMSSSSARKLGGASGGTDGLAGLTPELRARIERERRARAAEARLKTPGS